VAAVSETTKSLVALALSVVVCFAAAGIGGVATSKTVGTWYKSLEKPAWTPPDWVFGPVWSTLYLMMAVAAWLVWRRRSTTDVRWPLALFAAQLVLNAAWSWLFFALKSPGVALLELAALWCAILSTLVLFWRRAALSGWLMLPYLLWTTFALALNLAIWRLNA
jgi:tryptophan-rich sensory protein